MRIFSLRLRQRAKDLGLSDAEVARRCGLTERRYAHYVGGSREPDLETLVRICTVLAVTPNDLLLEAHGRQLEEREAEIARLNAAMALLDENGISLATAILEAVAGHCRSAGDRR